MSKSEIPVQEIGELMDTVSEKIPKMLRNVMSSFYSAESGREVGKSIGGLYQELVAAGIPEADALAMAKDYLSSISSMFNNAVKSGVQQGATHGGRGQSSAADEQTDADED
ncbi:MAG: hypothetical protein QM270_00225 [Bacillota bacterium]|nr:hypothetical protein [Bacillota bacterium]